MPDTLTPKDSKLLARLKASKAALHDAVTVGELLTIIERQQKAVEKSGNELQIANFKYSCLVVAAHGLDSAEGIAARELPTALKDECLLLRQQHDNAKAWREQQARPDTALKRYQAFHYESYYPLGGSGDICAEADTLPELVTACIAASRRSVEEILDLEAREWLTGNTFIAFDKQLAAAYDEAHPAVQGPRAYAHASAEQMHVHMLAVGAQAQPPVFQNYEVGPFFRPNTPADGN